MSALFFVTVLSVTFSVARSTECSDTNLGKCTNLVIIYGQPSAVVPWYSTAVIKDSCSRYMQFAQCLQDVLPNCDAKRKLLYQGLRDAYNFICNDGFDDYLQYQPCFANPGLQSEAAFCNETLNKKLKSLHDKSYNVSYRRARLCQYSDDYIDCIGNVIKSFCNLAAESWQRKFDIKTLCPLLVSQGCLGWATQCRAIGSIYNTGGSQSDSTPSWFVIVLSLSIALASLVIVAAVVILACFRFCPACRRRHASQQEQQPGPRRHSIPAYLPPPYPGPFIPGQGAASSSPVEPTAPNDIWRGGVDDTGGADGACGGSDVVKKWPIHDDVDDDEGHFVPDAAEMNAKLAEAIPPPPHISYNHRPRHSDHRHRQQRQHQPPQRQVSDDRFVPDEAVPDRSISPPWISELSPMAAGRGTEWRRQTSATTGCSDSGTDTSVNISASSSSAAGFAGSSSPTNCSPPSFYVPSNASSSSMSSQSRFTPFDDSTRRRQASTTTRQCTRADPHFRVGDFSSPPLRTISHAAHLRSAALLQRRIFLHKIYSMFSTRLRSLASSAPPPLPATADAAGPKHGIADFTSCSA